MKEERENNKKKRGSGRAGSLGLLVTLPYRYEWKLGPRQLEGVDSMTTRKMEGSVILGLVCFGLVKMVTKVGYLIL